MEKSFITKYEKTHILATRSLQLSMNAPAMVDVGDLTDCVKIAEKEFAQGKIPFTIRRYLPNNEFQDWKIEKNNKLCLIKN